MDLLRELSPLGWDVFHEANPLKVMQGCACPTVEDVAAGGHRACVKPHVPAAVFQDAVSEGAIDEVPSIQFDKFALKVAAFDDFHTKLQRWFDHQNCCGDGNFGVPSASVHQRTQSSICDTEVTAINDTSTVFP